MSLSLDKSTWKRVRLGDVAAASKEKVAPGDGTVDRFIAGEHMDSDDLKIHRWGDTGEVELGPAFHRRFRTGQVLYGSRRTYLRKVAVADFDGVCANTTFVVETREADVLLQEFLPFVMTSEPFHAFAIAESKGSVNPYVNWSDIERYEFDLPPLNEQKRIADLLCAVERHRLALSTTHETVSSSLGAFVDKYWTEGPLVPIAGIARCVTGSTPSKSNPRYWDSPDVPFYTPSEIKTTTMQTARQHVSEAGAHAGRMIPTNSVAIACIGGEMGKSAVAVEPGISNQQITSVVGLAEEDAYLLQVFLAHPNGRAAMDARETTTVVRKLNKSDLMKVELPWPSDRSAMKSSVRSHQVALGAVGAELDDLATLRSSLLNDIFGDN